MNPLTISILLPCYNASETLHTAIQSIVKQTYEDWQLYLLDDGSSDDSIEIAKAFNDKRIIITGTKENHGRVWQLNNSIPKITTKYIARMDADDIMFPERLEKQFKFLEANPDVDLLGAGIVSINKANEIKAIRFAPFRVESAKQVFQGEVLYHPVIIGKTNWFRMNPYPDNFDYCDDYALWCKSASNTTIANLHEPLLFYREHELFTYDKYCKRVKEMGIVMRDFGNQISGADRFKIRMKRHIKNLIYGILYYSGLWKFSYNMSSQSIERSEVEHFQRILSQLIISETADIKSIKELG